LALDGNGNVYVAEAARSRVGKYTTSGALVNASLISASYPMGLVENTNGTLFVTSYYNGTVGKYSTNGTTINASFITGLTNACSLALDGSGHLFVGSQGQGPGNNTGTGSIGEYTTSGGTVNASMITGLTQPNFLIAVSMTVPSPTASLIKAVKPAFSNLFVGINYQIQVSGDLISWTNLGSVFAATNTTLN
jgi:hypothetical protein